VRAGGTLTIEGYTDVGGVGGAIAKTAESVFAGFSAEQQAMSRTVLLRLTAVGDGAIETRRRARREELLPESPDRGAAVAEIIDTLVEARLLTSDGSTIEVAHEALIRHWPRLRGWLDEDREGMRLRGRLAQASADWVEEDESPSALYRGVRLAGALEWAAAHEAELNATERRFLRAGAALERRELDAAKRRTRRLLVVAATLGVLLVVAAGSAWLAIQQSRRADRQRMIAEAQADIATSRRLAAEALDQTDLDRALLASLEAYGTAPTVEARGALLAALERSPRLRATLHGHRPGTLVDDVVFTPSGTLLSAGDDGTLRRWDPGRARSAGPPLRIGGKLHALALDPADGRTLAVASSAGTITLMDVGGPSRAPPATRAGGPVSDLAFAPDGMTLVSADSAGRLRFWPVHGSRLGSPAVRRGDAGTIAFSPDGGTVATAGAESGAVALWDVGTRRVRGRLQASGVTSVSDLAFSADGRTLAAAGTAPALWDWRTGSELPVAGMPRHALAVAFDPTGATLAIAADDGTLRLVDVRRRRALGPPLEGHDGPAQALALSANGRELASAGTTDSAVRVWDTRRTPPLTSTTARVGAGRVTATAVSRDGDVLAAGDAQGDVTFGTTAGGAMPATWEHAHQAAIVDLALSDDGRRAASLDAGGAVRTWDVAGGRMLRSDLSAGRSAEQVLVSPHGSVAVTTGFSLPAQSAPAAGARPATILERSSPGYGAAFSRDGRRLAVGLLSGIQLWHDGRRGPLIARSGAAAVGESVALAFSPGGRELASGDTGGRVAIWALDGSTEPERVARAHDGAVTALAFTRDGRVLVSAGGDGTLTLTDVATGRRLGARVPSPHATVDALALTKAGALVSADKRGGLAVWDRLLLSESLAAWRARICRLTGRSLSREEWAALIPDEPHRTTCG
jgi:WD40 repeat protein